MESQKSKKNSEAKSRRLAFERIWKGDAQGARYFPPGDPVPPSAWQRAPIAQNASGQSKKNDKARADR